MSDSPATSSDCSAAVSPVSRVALPAILLVAILLRCASLDSVPPGLWFDEALNAQDAVHALRGGGLQWVYPDEFPREPMFETLLIGVTRLIGPKTAAYRATSGVIGILTILALYFCARAGLGEERALLASAVLATLRWHVIFSRIILRTIVLPLWITLIVLAAQWTRCKPTFHRAALFGALIGGGFYTYLAWYFMLPGVAILFVWVFWNSLRDPMGRRFTIFALATALIVASPLFNHYREHPEHLFARPAAVSPFTDGGAGHEIGKNFLQALGMFHVRGDHVPKQNIPHAPALNRIEGLFFALGVLFCAARAWRRAPFETILLVWLALGLAPTIFTKTDSPNFLRTLVLTPAVAAITACGIWGAAQYAAPYLRASNSNRLLLLPLILGWLLICGGITYWQVQVQWARSEEVWESFTGPYTQLGRAAAATPEGASFWVPAYISEHRTFQFLSAPDPDVISPEIHPYVNFDFLRSRESGEGPRRIAATAHNNIFPVLRELTPKGRVVEEFKSPTGRTWALLYEVAPGDLPAHDKVDAAEKNHNVADIRW
ncbi:glycosyltransferase family 39 protein [Candidatus Sumerlaeota bacterium]|nr:glycosyltransferase family 39 protein [Candidatus Sumerlaeota bacterium]MBI3736726.1 glycosyltransferase family 39 protein [Candidatus Sumerlaeota bacterium]